MATVITFADGDTAQVAEEPGQVADAITAAGGAPVMLTLVSTDEPLYVNPAAVIQWRKAPKR